MKNSFVLYSEYQEQLKSLKDDQMGVLFRAIMAYSSGTEIPEMDGMTEIAFAFIKSRMDKDSKKYQEIVEKRSAAGKKGGRPKSDSNPNESSEKQNKANESKAKQKNPDNVFLMLGVNDDDKDKSIKTETRACAHEDRPDNPINPDKPEEQKPEKPDVNPDAEKKQPEDVRFDEFWKQYPKKVGKEAAKRIWKRIRPTAELHGRIIAAVQKARSSPQWEVEHGRFIPNPATWLNQGRWDDEIEEERQPHVNTGTEDRTAGFKTVQDY